MTTPITYDEIKKRHEEDDDCMPASCWGLDALKEGMEQAHADRATLLKDLETVTHEQG